MTEKRFTLNDLDNIQDNNPKGRLYILTERGGVKALCNLINGLNDKSNRLEKESGKLKQFKEQNIKEYLRLKTVCSEYKQENEELKQQIKHIQATLSIINGCLQDEGVLTLEKYREIQDYRYNQWKGDME